MSIFWPVRLPRRHSDRRHCHQRVGIKARSVSNIFQHFPTSSAQSINHPSSTTSCFRWLPFAETVLQMVSELPSPKDAAPQRLPVLCPKWHLGLWWELVGVDGLCCGNTFWDTRQTYILQKSSTCIGGCIFRENNRAHYPTCTYPSYLFLSTVSLSTWHMQYQGLRPRRPRRHRRPRGVWKKATPRGLRWCTWPSFWPRIWRTWCSQDRRVAGWQDDSLMFMQVIGLHQIQQQQTRNHNQPLAKNQLQHAATTCKAIQQQDLEFIRASASA